ncbi:MAG: amidohydrolase family protein, partial [Acidobacteriia bacterium]|nr:amidohydrolase family protein [Terriglobia bacterium]
ILLGIGVLALWEWRRRLGTFDLIIYNARIFDWERMLNRGLCVGIGDGKISSVGILYAARARRWLNAHGQVLAPGFIDVHTHVERNIPRNRPFRAPNFVRQGVTTLITGNCGTSSVEIGALLSGLAKHGSQVNVATLVGHNSVREAIMGHSAEAASDDAIAKMSGIVERNMAAGALGFSSGLAYSPGCFAKRDEIVRLAQVAGRHGGMYVTHLRDEGIAGEQALEEAIQIARMARTPLHVSHFKIAVASKWGSAAARLERLDHERSAGLRITLDVYGYHASSTSMELLLPKELRGNEINWRRLENDPARRTVVVKSILARLEATGFPSFSYARIAYFGFDRGLEGSTITDVASARDLGKGKSAPDLRAQVDAILYLLSHGGAQMVYTDMKEEDVETILQDPYTSFGTDSAVRGGEQSFVHPRGVGNFARILGHYVREAHVLTLEEALRKMTSLAADTFGLNHRGRVMAGYAADLVIFDPDHIEDHATYDAPLDPPTGISFVFVNGALALDHGQTTDRNAGRPLRRVQTDTRGPLSALKPKSQE